MRPANRPPYRAAWSTTIARSTRREADELADNNVSGPALFE
jgi:hypothetical protein